MFQTLVFMFQTLEHKFQTLKHKILRGEKKKSLRGKEKKLLLSFCVLLAFSYLCTQKTDTENRNETYSAHLPRVLR